jgi:hypothetical protein
MKALNNHLEKCNKLHELVDAYYESFFTESGNISRSPQGQIEALEEIIYAAIKFKNQAEEAVASNLNSNFNSI